LADFGVEKLFKKLIGKTSVEDALLRLDSLTKEESLMAVANILKVADHVDGNVEETKVLAETTDGRVQEIDQTVKAVKERTQRCLSSFTPVPTLFPIAYQNRNRWATTSHMALSTRLFDKS
jgi:hypothetical protein